MLSKEVATGTLANGGASIDIQTVFLTDNGLAPSAGGRPLGEFWRISKFGHAELNYGAGFGGTITYQIIIDGQIQPSMAELSTESNYTKQPNVSL